MFNRFNWGFISEVCRPVCAERGRGLGGRQEERPGHPWQSLQHGLRRQSTETGRKKVVFNKIYFAPDLGPGLHFDLTEIFVLYSRVFSLFIEFLPRMYSKELMVQLQIYTTSDYLQQKKVISFIIIRHN